MRRKKPRPAPMDEVKISRDREDAVIEYADEAIGGMNLRIGAIGWARQTLESIVLGDCAIDREMFRQSVKRIMPMFDE